MVRRSRPEAVTDYAAFQALTAMLRGEAPNGAVDWMGVLAAANHALVTPSLAAALSRNGAAQPPDEVRSFLDEVTLRTRERNRRLAVQLSDIAAALNHAGIEPLALKGAAFLLDGMGPAPLRIVTDLDLLVFPEEAEAATAALQVAGFDLLARYGDFESHVAAELGRDEDVGAVDLHRRRPGPLHLASDPSLERPTLRCEIPGGVVLRGSPAARIMEIVLHDLFHDGDYWRGALDLRHLLDIAALCATHDVDWSLFSEPALGALGRRAARRHLIAAHDLVGASVPSDLLASTGAGLEYRRALWQMRVRPLRPPLLAVSLVAQSPDIASHFRREQAWRARFADVKVTTLTRTRGRLNRIGQWLGPPPLGKL